ncbi:acyltransferase family protein [Mucilaginibacter sp. OK098]|uniref:acyltransferase family protein n=1 Tax=Mucilaginibacter sp. OK098 TaxID=1855297 RepID=UPI00091F706A|nr:acyltransferase [Mucilaginibacter sp. OK098]SHN24148.1 Peptidoglycan/LPS O-acetylase OafA/YrhL, contains acyltransferase and SGNH-hydrolase domains [Mucilaginibacter sp. OK098]
MNSKPEKLDYIPGLDGIRALAALLVISTHWPNNSLSLKFGWIGVNIFFVLSGFLITRILVNEKQRAFKQYLSNFFYKRALRIFPIYYLFIFSTTIIILLIYCFIPALSKDGSLIAGLNAIKYDLPFYLTYTYNIKLNLAPLFHFGDYSNDFFGHLWSLAIEEQFYIIFPFLVYFLDSKQLKKLVIAIIIICPLIRLWAALIGTHLVSNKYWLGELLYTNTFCQADALAAGALLALYPIKIKFPYRTFFVVMLIFLVTGLTCLYFLRQAGYFLVDGKSLGYDFPAFWFTETTSHFLINIRGFYQYSLVNLLAFFLIAPAVIKKPLFPAVLQSKPISYLGKISYGVYLFHYPIKAFFVMGGSFFGGWFKLTANPFIHISIFILYLFVVIMLAHFSYQYFERKIMMKYKPNNVGN